MKPVSLLLLLLFPVVTSAANGLIQLDAEQAKAAGIATAPLASLASGGERPLPGQVVVPPTQMAAVSAPLSGVVTVVKAAHGEAVKRGQLLARLQGPELLGLQRELASARAQADVAAEARRRDESLFADGIISRARLSVTQAADRQAAAMLAEKRAAHRLAGAPEAATNGDGLSGSSDVRAPFDGVVLEAPVQPGQRVDATAVLFKLGRLDRLWIEIQATASQASGLAPGDRVSVPGCAAVGKLALVSPHLNAATQSLLLRAEFPETKGCLKPFQFVQAQIDPSPGNGDGRTWRVPSASVVRHQGQAWLFAEARGGFLPLAVRVVDEAERTTLVEASNAAIPLSGDQRIAVGGTAAIKAVWLGLGAGKGY